MMWMNNCCGQVGMTAACGGKAFWQQFIQWMGFWHGSVFALLYFPKNKEEMLSALWGA